MSSRTSRKSIVLALSLLGLFSNCALANVDTNATAQDTKKAAHYFEEEMNFKTNPYGTNLVVQKKIQNVTIVDVRTEEDFKKGHIPGAINIPYDKYSNFQGNETEFPGLRKEGYNYVYCYQLLCNLSQKAAVKFAKVGYPVKEIVGGFESWQSQGYPVEK